MSAPIGPRIPPVLTTDAGGTFTLYVDKHCSRPGCGVQLTSRNRYGRTLYCRLHGREYERNRVRPNKSGSPCRTGKPRPVQMQLSPEGLPVARGTHSVDEERQAVHRAVTLFLTTPTDLALRENIEEALKLFEMRFYMKAIEARPRTEFVTLSLTKNSPRRIDMRPSQAVRAEPEITIPCDEITFTNPDHRSTRSEFLADCSTYGV